MAHTPGPWKLVGGYARSPDGTLVVNVKGLFGQGPDERTANARLIAAAPELLSALKAFLNGDASMSHMMVTHEDARRVVAQAEGDESCKT